MKNYFLALSVVGSFLFFSCDNAGEKSTDDPATDSLTETEIIPMPSGEALPLEGKAQPAATTAEGMNPPHGEPGHRCDIAVGAPLNSAPGQQAAPPTIIQQQPATTTATTPTQTAPGMNPPHGEPGHDCSIAVGAPLKK